MTIVTFICPDEQVPVNELTSVGITDIHTYAYLSGEDVMRISEGNFFTNALLREVSQTIVNACREH